MLKFLCFFLLLFAGCFPYNFLLYAQESKILSEIKGVHFSQTAPTSDSDRIKIPPETIITYQWFLAYSNGECGAEDFSKFFVNRGYINIISTFGSFISTRITPDLTTDMEGDGEGDLEMRFKYLDIVGIIF